MVGNEVDRFIEVWDRESKKTAELLSALPADKYDFRPDAGGRSLGELAWHLAEAEGYITFGVEAGAFTPEARPPGIERPRKVEDLAPGFERVHRDAVTRVRKLKPDAFDRNLQFFSMPAMPIREVLWNFVLLHNVHHRGQLTVLCRLAGGCPTALYGPRREEMPLPKAQA